VDAKSRKPIWGPGFPPQRQDEPPPLNEKHERFVSRFSAYCSTEGHPYSGGGCELMGCFFSFLWQEAYFPLVAVLFSIGALLLTIGTIAAWAFAIDRMRENSSTWATIIMSVLSAIFVLLLGIGIPLNNGSTSRRTRWVNYQWRSYDSFVHAERWMQYIGIIYMYCAIMLASIILAFIF
jgi:hypothetical protein